MMVLSEGRLVTATHSKVLRYDEKLPLYATLNVNVTKDV